MSNLNIIWFLNALIIAKLSSYVSFLLIINQFLVASNLYYISFAYLCFLVNDVKIDTIDL